MSFFVLVLLDIMELNKKMKAAVLYKSPSKVGYTITTLCAEYGVQKGELWIM